MLFFLLQLAMGKMMEQGPVLIITFQAQIVMVIKNQKGEVVEGDPVSGVHRLHMVSLGPLPAMSVICSLFPTAVCGVFAFHLSTHLITHKNVLSYSNGIAENIGECPPSRGRCVRGWSTSPVRTG